MDTGLSLIYNTVQTTKNRKVVRTMQYTAPHYYKKFHCTGGDCPDTCCAGWQIQIDPASLKRYRHTKGVLGNRLRNEIDWKESSFRRYDGRCAFLNEDSLCDLYLEGGGVKAFCHTCRTYPKHIEEFEGLREISLSLSCPVSAELILGCRETVRFLHAEDDREEGNFGDFDYFLFTKLMDARGLILDILQDRKHPFAVRAVAALALSHDLQERIDKNGLYDADRLLEQYASGRMWDWFETKLSLLKRTESREEMRLRTQRELFRILSQLEELRPDWKPYLRDSCRILEQSRERATGADDSFHELFTDIMEEQILVYFIFTYFCGAVYSGNAYGKMKFSVACLFLIRELARAGWLKNPDQTSISDVIRTAWRYAREIEHSDYNKTTMEVLLDREDLFGLENFFSIL